MADSWHEGRWGDLAVLEYGRALRNYRNRSGKFRVFGTNGPIGWHDEPLCSHPTVVVGRKGAYRGVQYSPDPCFVIDTAFYLRPTTKIDVRWAYYQLLTQDINGMDSGSAIPSTSRAAFYELPVLIPPLQIQRLIGEILGTIDERIALSHRSNHTLHAMASAIFQSWFVDFDPVRARMRSDAVELPQELAAHLPDRLVASEIGKIPSGWTSTGLAEAMEINPPRQLVKGEHAPYLGMASMPTRSHRPLRVEHQPFGSGTRFVNGDTLVARISPCLENGKTAFVDFLADGETGWGSTEYIILHPKPPLPELFAYFLARTTEFREFAVGAMTGSSGRQRVPVQALSDFRFAMPPRNIAQAFGKIVDPLMRRSSMAADCATTLIDIRDAILPRLVSGSHQALQGTML